jgi:hypothetical protein
MKLRAQPSFAMQVHHEIIGATIFHPVHRETAVATIFRQVHYEIAVSAIFRQVHHEIAGLSHVLGCAGVCLGGSDVLLRAY